MKKWQIKAKARTLRRQGLSYKEITAKTGLSKSTLSSWVGDIKLSAQQRLRLGSKYDQQSRGALTNKIRRQKEIARIMDASKAGVAKMSDSEFKIAGLMLYWAEGNKTVYPGVANSDPDLIKLMMKWFRQVCNVPKDKFKIHLHLHSGQDEAQAKRFWSEQTGIPVDQFGKSHIKKEGTGHKKNILYFGTAKIGIYNKDLLYKILGMIEGIKDFF